MSITPWKVLESNYIRNNARIDRCETPNGHIVEPLILEYGIWVNVLAITEQGEVILVKQYRHGVKKVLWELPGGAAEQGESPLEAANRELLEETGYCGERFIQTGKVYPNPASHTNTHYSFLALDVKKVSQQHLDKTEEIDVFLFPPEQVRAMVAAGDLPQSLHVNTFFFALMHLDRIP
jgi:8-oxo-dGTP pyrophosphatase MutT (NUDIX family)